MKDRRLTEEEKKKIKPVNQGGGPNYLGKQETVTVPKKWLSDPDHVVAELAYITPREQKILLDANIYGSLKGKPNKGPGGIMSLQGDLGGYDASPGGPNDGKSGGGGPGGRVGQLDKNKQRAADIMTGRVNVSSPTGVTEGYKGPTGVQVGGIGDFIKSKYVGPSLFNPGGYRDVYTKGPNIGQVKPGVLGRVLGGIGSLITGVPLIGPVLGRMYDYGTGFFNKDYFDDMDEEEKARIRNLQLIDGELIDTRTLDFDPDAKISDTSFTLNDPNAIVNNITNRNNVFDYNNSVGRFNTNQAVNTNNIMGASQNMVDANQIADYFNNAGITATSQFDLSPYGRINEDMVP